MISSFVDWIYQRSFFFLIQWGIVVILCLVCLYRSCRDRMWWRPLQAAVLFVWFAAVLYVTLLSRENGGNYSISLIPFHSYLELLQGGTRELLRSNFMNAYLFFPAGAAIFLLCPSRWSTWKRGASTVLICACLSLSIESLQYLLVRGHFEMDDILHNTLGAAAGCALCGIACQSPRWHPLPSVGFAGSAGSDDGPQKKS